jgi:hypothetical protein
MRRSVTGTIDRLLALLIERTPTSYGEWESSQVGQLSVLHTIHVVHR